MPKTILEKYENIICLFHYVDMYASVMKTMVDAAAGTLTQIKFLTANCINIHCIVYQYTNRVKNQSKDHFKISFMHQQNMLNILNLQSFVGQNKKCD